MSTVTTPVTDPVDAEDERAATPKASALPEAEGHECRVAALDGIRGLAILLVLFYHFREMGYPTFFGFVAVFLNRWGWTGVDLFFVLSGYLITGILLDAKGSRGYFTNFYARRAVRIFPAYYATLIFFFWILPLIAPGFLRQIGWGTAAVQWHYWTYLSNYPSLLHAPLYKPLGPMWSLAIEEQFYLVWPALVFLLDRRRMVQLCLFLMIAIFSLRLGLLARNFSLSLINFASFTRADGLATGALIALLFRTPEVWPKVRRYAWLVGLLAISVLVIVVLIVDPLLYDFGDDLNTASRYTLFNIVFGSLLVTCVGSAPGAVINRVFGTAVLRFFGRYSYGMYLYHFPLLLALHYYDGPRRTIPGKLMQLSVFMGGTTVLALISWHLMEKHMLKLKKYFPTHHAKLAV